MFMDETKLADFLDDISPRKAYLRNSLVVLIWYDTTNDIIIKKIEKYNIFYVS